jgi:CelD/BcsL family acetyltransferase involved in cellulose biosynthesis
VSEFRLRQLHSADELRQSAAAWDDLWQRSDVASPAVRAELVALRVDYLASRSAFRGMVVEYDGRMVAALPLVNRRLKGVLNVGALPCNCWMAGGALLLDPAVDTAAALDCLMPAIADLPWPLLWLDQVSFNDSNWQAFRSAAARAGLAVSVREHYQIGQVEIGDDWEHYTTRKLKGDHRRKINRLVRKLDEAGGAELKIYRAMTPDQVDELLRRGFEVEDRSWKRAEGTSVLRNPAIFEQYRREAHVLARLGLLELIFLEHRGQPIAFVYGWNAKGVHFLAKVGYDESFARFAPGQQLLLRLLESYHSDPSMRLLDFAGPYVDFHKVWTGRSYPVGPLVVATPRLVARGLFHAYTQWQPRARRLKQRVVASGQLLRATAESIGRLFGRPRQALAKLASSPETDS